MPTIADQEFIIGQDRQEIDVTPTFREAYEYCAIEDVTSGFTVTPHPNNRDSI